jgi:fatty acid synthase subunit alpha
MAMRTLKAKYEARDDSITHPRIILCHAKNGKEIYYQFEDELAHVQAEPISDVAPAISPAPVQTAAAPITAPSGPAMSVDDVPIKANDVLNVIVAKKLKKKKVEEVPLSKSIKDLVGGKSTLQNEILGDLQMEFTSAPWGLGPSRSDGVLLLGTTMEPAKRLGSEAEAKAWLDTVATAYAQRSGISLSV